MQAYYVWVGSRVDQRGVERGPPGPVNYRKNQSQRHPRQSRERLASWPAPMVGRRVSELRRDSHGATAIHCMAEGMGEAWKFDAGRGG